MSLHARKESIDREIHERQLSPMLRISWNLQRSTPEAPKSRDKMWTEENNPCGTPGQPVEIED